VEKTFPYPREWLGKPWNGKVGSQLIPLSLGSSGTGPTKGLAPKNLAQKKEGNKKEGLGAQILLN